MNNQRLLISSLFAPFLVATLVGCGAMWGPDRIHSNDPNQAKQEQSEEKINKSNNEDFIVAHPELDEKTKKELRDGTLNTAGALDRMKNTPKQ
jgi:hypothetical protein